LPRIFFGIFRGETFDGLLYLWEVHYGMDFIEVYEVVTPISKEHPEESHVCCNVLLEVLIIASRLALNCSLHILDVVVELASLFRCIQSQFPFFNLLGFIVGPGAAAKERESFSSRLNIRNTFPGLKRKSRIAFIVSCSRYMPPSIKIWRL
jgi:hypothetical protein